ncbi:MAG: shikimate kinase [Lachnospiraceae bacterium]|nr:shikimate kinase [Lachnospiraceae bacterium]
MVKGNIYLIGFMGTGKSTVSHSLADLLGFEEIDTDAWIVREQKRSIKEIFDSQGEEYFRDLETELIERIAKEEKKIISCGGGIVLRKANREQMKKSGLVVLLTAEPETIFSRVCQNTERPVLNGNMNASYIADLLQQRNPYYIEAGEIVVATDCKTPEEIAQKIQREIKNIGINEKNF